MRLRALVVAVLVLVLGAWTCAPTAGTSTGSGGGDVPISTTGLTALVEGEDWHYVGESGEPAFQNSWENSGGNPALAFRIREAGIVDIQGTIVSGANGSVVFTLPEGYRPSANVFLPAFNFSPSAAYVVVGENGGVSCYYNGISGLAKVVYGQLFLNPPDVP